MIFIALDQIYFWFFPESMLGSLLFIILICVLLMFFLIFNVSIYAVDNKSYSVRHNNSLHWNTSVNVKTFYPNGIFKNTWKSILRSVKYAKMLVFLWPIHSCIRIESRNDCVSIWEYMIQRKLYERSCNSH